jgi:hypothetical protein
VPSTKLPGLARNGILAQPGKDQEGEDAGGAASRGEQPDWHGVPGLCLVSCRLVDGDCYCGQVIAIDFVRALVLLVSLATHDIAVESLACASPISTRMSGLQKRRPEA